MDLPPIVAKNELISLKDLNLSRVTVWANLPQACQKLYHNVAGNKITLETEDFKEFSHVIHTSVTTPGYWGHRALRSKCKDPENPDPSEFRYKYLRVTIGSSQVCSLPTFLVLMVVRVLAHVSRETHLESHMSWKYGLQDTDPSSTTTATHVR